MCLSCPDVIVGVNKYKLAKEEQLEVLSIDNSHVLKIQVLPHSPFPPTAYLCHYHCTYVLAANSK